MKICKDNIDYIKEELKKYKSKELVEIDCYNCNKKISKSKKAIQVSLKNNRSMFCDSNCYYEYARKGSWYKCQCCNKDVWRTKSNLNKTVFCSRSCASKIINQIRFLPEIEQRKLLDKNINAIDKNCSCGNSKSYGVKYCLKCKKNNTKENLNLITLKELKLRDKTYKSTIRFYARKYFKDNSKDLKECKICKYNLYVELCHMKPVSEYDENSTLGEINSPDNLIYLCPNHHKELDLNLLDRKQLK